MTDVNITPTPLQLENRIKWVALLRSDKYTQTRETLAETRTGKKRCCLGVACDPSITPGLIVDLRGDGRVAFDDEGLELPARAQAALGFERGDPRVPIEGLDLSVGTRPWSDQVGLTRLNDEHKFTFAQIADVIERNFITPFVGVTK